MKAATDNQITQLRRHAVNSVTGEIMAHGTKLTWDQANDLGDEVINWMRTRLGLKSTTSDRGITFKPDPGAIRAHATIRYSPAHKSSRSGVSPADIRAVASLAEQDMSGEVDDSYARTGDAKDTIQRWYDSARSAGDTDLIKTIDRMGVAAAAKAYEAARLSSMHATKKFRATIHERGNGLADVGDFVAGDDGEVYRVVSLTGPIHTGPSGVANYMYATVELADWDDVTDDEAMCSAIVGRKEGK